MQFKEVPVTPEDFALLEAEQNEAAEAARTLRKQAGSELLEALDEIHAMSIRQRQEALEIVKDSIHEYACAEHTYSSLFWTYLTLGAKYERIDKYHRRRWYDAINKLLYEAEMSKMP